MNDAVAVATTTFDGLTNRILVFNIPILSLAINLTAIFEPAAPLVGAIGAYPVLTRVALLIVGTVVSNGALQYLNEVVISAVAFATKLVLSVDPVPQATGKAGAVPELHPEPKQVDEVIGPPGLAPASIILLSSR